MIPIGTSTHAEPRAFLTRTYPTMKKHNPHTPIMMREASGTEPRVFARYGTSPCQILFCRCIRKFGLEEPVQMHGPVQRPAIAFGLGERTFRNSSQHENTGRQRISNWMPVYADKLLQTMAGKE